MEQEQDHPAPRPDEDGARPEAMSYEQWCAYMGSANGNGDAGQSEKPRKPTITKDSKGLEKALQELGYEYRYNLRAQHFEVRFYEDRTWLEINDRKDATLREVIAERFAFPASKKQQQKETGQAQTAAHFGRVSWQDSINALADRSEVDPFAEWLAELPQWDQRPRLTGWLRMVFDIEESEPGTAEHSLVSWASRTLLLGPIARAFMPGYKLDEMVVLIGPQGCGKSTAIRWLLPPDERDEWFDDGLHLAALRKEQAEALQGVVYLEAAEMAGGGRAELESLKAFLSRTNDRARLAYRHNPESLPRRAVIVGTSNDRQPLPNDPSGNRRFVPVVVRALPGGAGAVREYLDEHRVQLWAEARYIWAHREELNVHPWLPPELVDVQTEATTDHRRSDELLENKLNEWLVMSRPENFELGEVAWHVGLISAPGEASKMARRDALRLAAALRNAGFEKRRKRVAGGRTYVWSRAD